MTIKFQPMTVDGVTVYVLFNKDTNTPATEQETMTMMLWLQNNRSTCVTCEKMFNCTTRAVLAGNDNETYCSDYKKEV